MSRFTSMAVVATALSLLVGGAASPARAQCDPGARWDVFSPTGDISEVLTVGQIAWVAANGGVIRIDLATADSNNPSQIKLTDTDGLVSVDITCMVRDNFGNIWIGTREDGVSIFDANGNHLQNLNSFVELRSDLTISMSAEGNRVVVTSADEFTPQGNPDKGGFVVIEITDLGGGNFSFDRVQGLTPDLDVGRETLAEPGQIWFGTNGDGLWRRDESVTPATLERVLTSEDGLPSTNVKKIVRAPVFGQSGDQLWIGTGFGLVTWDETNPPVEVTPFVGHNILDLYRDGNTMYVLSEVGTTRDLYTLDLTAAPATIRVPRATCFPDTTYVPREVAVDSNGRVVLGTRTVSFAVREGFDWSCPPPLGPHTPAVTDLTVAGDGTLYFATSDKNAELTLGNGVGVFQGGDWSAITRDNGIVSSRMAEVLHWPDGTIWFASSISASDGGLNRYFPDTGALETYHNAVQNTSRRTLGRNVFSLKNDRQGNLWVVYGQVGGGLSVIDRNSLQVTNYDFNLLFSGLTDLVRDVAFDSLGRVWVCTHDTATKPAQLYVLDLNGTIHNQADDSVFSFNMANEIFDLDECWQIDIDSNDRILIAGDKGIVYSDISSAGFLPGTWNFLSPTSQQTGGRSPQPYRVMELDWEENWWFGTQASGLVRVSNDLQTWDWYDQLEGCPLPDQAVTGLYPDGNTRTMWVGTAAGGIARLNLSASGTGGGGEETDASDPQAFPNPWNPDEVAVLNFGAFPSNRTIDVRIFDLTGDLVFEQLGAFGGLSWSGVNVGGKLIESGVYLVMAQTADGGEPMTWEGKVAVIR